MNRISHKFVPAPRLVCIEVNPGPGRGHEWSEETKWRIITLWKYERKSFHSIAKALNVDRSNVRRLIKKYEETMSTKRKSGQGRKRKLTASEERKIKRRALAGKKAKEITADYNAKHQNDGKCETPLSEITVRRSLERSGLRYLTVKPQEELTRDQMEKRLAYAKAKRSFDWKMVLFTDEKTFVVGASEEMAWQDPKDRKTRKKLTHPSKLHVWGGIGHFFKTDLHFFTENLNAKLLTSILNKRLPPNYSLDCPETLQGGWLFQQDNDPKHKARITTQLLDKIAPDRIRDHPPNSPDLNPIEDVWSYLTEQIKKKRIDTVDQLQRHLKQEWDRLPFSVIRKSVSSMPSRIQQCVTRRGKRTDY